jgi:hypothetical protein
MKYKLWHFRPHIYQEIRRVKFLNYLEKKRTKKRREYAKSKDNESKGDVTFKRNK